MFTKLFYFASAIASVLAAATTEPASQCNTGPVQCCDQSGTASTPAIANELGVLGVVVQDVNALIGLDCTPITVVGAGSGTQCSASPLCCENNNFNGLVAIGCTPVNLNL